MTGHHTFAQDLVIIGGQALYDLRACISAAHQFQQAHIAHRVEIMSDGKALPEGQRHLGDQKLDWNGGGVGGDDAGVTDHCVQTLVEIALDIKALHNGFDDPIAVRQLVKVSFNRAGLYQLDIAVLMQRCRFRFLQPLQSVICGFGGEIQQQNLMARICDLSRNTGSHGASANDCDAFKCHAMFAFIRKNPGGLC